MRFTNKEWDEYLDFLDFKTQRGRYYSRHSHSRSPDQPQRSSRRRSHSRSRRTSYKYPSRYSPYSPRRTPSPNYSEYSSGSPQYTEKSLEASGDKELPPLSATSASNLVADSNQLPSALLEALGQKTQHSPAAPTAFHSILAEAWLKLLEVEFTKEWRHEARSEFPVPNNCLRLRPPKLNAEIVAALPSTCKDRDSRILERQSGVSAGLVALGTVLSEMLSTRKEEYAKWISLLSKSSHFFLDTFAEDSAIRRSLALGNLNPTVRDILKTSIWGEFLFGDKLKEDITVAKQISQSASELVASKQIPAQQKSQPASSNHQHTFQGSLQGGQHSPRYQSRNTNQPSSRPRYSSNHSYQHSSQGYHNRRDNRKR